MLSGQILNSDATLNNFIVINSKSFIPGEEIDLIVRVVNLELDSLRYVPPATNIATFTFTDTDGNTIEKTASMNADDRSIMTISLSEAETESLIGGNISFELDLLGDGTSIKKGVIQNGLARIIDGDC